MVHHTDEDYRHLAVVQAHLSLLAAVTRDPSRTDELAALLAEDFTWQTPSIDPARGQTRDRASYLALFANPALVPAAERLVELEVELLAVTVQGKRVAGETLSSGRRGDGIAYGNRYHQLWLFDDNGQIAEYRIYADTLQVAALHTAGHELVARRLIDGLACGSADRVVDILGAGLRWQIHRPSGEVEIFDRTAALSRITHEPLISLAPIRDTILSQGETMVVETALPSGQLHLFFLTFEAGLIAVVREYQLQTTGRAV
ncbi:hypothetical protein ACFB49_09710 [Sphingomonas sp. DBB INV C78]